jgi:hypothetical protein
MVVFAAADAFVHWFAGPTRRQNQVGRSVPGLETWAPRAEMGSANLMDLRLAY